MKGNAQRQQRNQRNMNSEWLFERAKVVFFSGVSEAPRSVVVPAIVPTADTVTTISAAAVVIVIHGSSSSYGARRNTHGWTDHGTR